MFSLPCRMVNCGSYERGALHFAALAELSELLQKIVTDKFSAISAGFHCQACQNSHSPSHLPPPAPQAK